MMKFWFTQIYHRKIFKNLFKVKKKLKLSTDLPSYMHIVYPPMNSGY